MEGVKHQLHTFLAVMRQTPEHRSADPTILRAQRERLENICAASDAAVYVDSRQE